MTELTLHHWPQSRSSTALWMLEEVGQPYEVKLVDITKGEQKADALVARNPMGKVPTLVHGDVVITETAAICAYLADAFPEAGLAPPPGDPARGTYYRWLFFTAGCVEAAMTDRALGRAESERTGMVGYGTWEDTMRTLATAFDPGPYILGERFSAADVYVGSSVVWGRMFGSLPDTPAFARYAAAIEARPGFQSYSAKNMAMMPAAA